MGVAAAMILGQTTQGSGSIGQPLMWVGIMIVVVVIGTIVLMAVRRRMIGQRVEISATFGTMEDMRAMVARGDMSQEEYEQVRKAMIARVKQAQDASERGAREIGGNGNRSETGSTSTR